MDEIKNLLENNYKNSSLKAEVASWINKYDGKIIEFQIDEHFFSVILTKEKWRILEESYPSPDVTFATSTEILDKIVNGSLKLSQGIKEEGSQILGNFHDLKWFFEIVKKGK